MNATQGSEVHLHQTEPPNALPYSTGNPAGNFYANPAIYAPGSVSLSNVRISYAEQAVWVAGSGSRLALSDSQVYDCQAMAVLGSGGYGSGLTLTCNNFRCDAPYYGIFVYDNGGGGNSYGLTNCTLNNVYYLVAGQNYYYYNQGNAVNCVFASGYMNVTGYCTWSGNHNGFYYAGTPFGSSTTSTTSNPFQTWSGNNFYLMTGSRFHNIGTSAISSTLLADLATRTTYAPLDGGWLDNYGMPDLGYHYYPIPVNTMVVAWGDDESGQCNVPAGLTNAIAVAGGFDFSLALKADGTVIGWGNTNYGALNIPANLTNVRSIAAGGDFAMALLQNRTVIAWGTNDFGQTNVPAGLTNVTAIAAGYNCSFALKNDGTVVAWGNNAFGQTNIPAVGPIAQIAAGNVQGMALLTNGTVAMWAANNYAGLPYYWGITNVPAGLSNVVSISSGAYHALALKSNGLVMAWGAGTVANNGGIDDYGQCIVPAGLSNVVAVSGGRLYSAALKSDGTVKAWGDDDFNHELELPDRLTGVQKISAGGFHGLAIRSGPLTPVIWEEPEDQFALAGNTVTFSSESEGVDGMTYQWQFNGVNISGAINASLTLTGVQAVDNGSYQVVISDSAGSVTSDVASFTLVTQPQVTSMLPTAPSTNWIATSLNLSVTATDADPMDYPLSYQWQFNGTNIAGATSSSYLINIYNLLGKLTYNGAQEGIYTLVISNAAGSTNITWDVRLALPGMVVAWGDNVYGECKRPVTLTNVLALATGKAHGVVALDNGMVTNWGSYWTGTNFIPVITPPPLTNVIAVAAGSPRSRLENGWNGDSLGLE